MSENENNFEIKWQDGLIAEVGVNGLQVTDVLKQTIKHIEELDQKLQSDENQVTLNYLRSALASDERRTANRKARGVESTNNK